MSALGVFGALAVGVAFGYGAGDRPRAVHGVRRPRRVLRGDGGRQGGLRIGDFYAEPVPRVTLRGPGRVWHAGKVLFEKVWLWRWF